MANGVVIILCFSVFTAQGSSELHVYPSKFQDKEFMDFSCSARLLTKQLLCWYQVKGSKSILLNITQQLETDLWKTVKLKKTLEPSDNGTKIFCSKQSLLSNRSFSEGQETQRIPIVFQKEIKPLDVPFVTIEPNDATVYFDVGSTLLLNCSGSGPVDGRSYTWFLINAESKLTVPDIDKQTYNASTNINPLQLPLDESHHRNQLFCAQEWHSYIVHTDGSLRRKTYGQRARSKRILLIQRGREVQPTQMLALVVPLTLVAIAAAVVVVLWRRRGRKQERCTTDEDEDYACTYGTREVTYAALTHSTDAHSMPEKPDSNYASIIGVLIPNTGNGIR